MKRFFLLFMTLALLVCALAACGSTAPTVEPEAPSTDATETPEATKYTVKWYDESGAILGSSSVTEGATPSYSYTPASTAEWKKELAGWSLTQGGAATTVTAADKDISYYAVVSATKQVYTVSFVTGCELIVDSITKEYGELVEAPSVKRDGYRFVSWCTDAQTTVAADWTKPVTANVTYYAAWEKTVDIKALLETLLSSYEANPYEYIPTTMRPDYAPNLVDSSDVVTDYSSFVNVGSIATGFGEQWNMVIDNIEQSAVFFNALSVVETLATTSMSTFNNYFDRNPSDTAHHSFASGIYTVTVDFDGTVISYILDFTATYPIIGTETVQISLTMDVTSGERDVRVQLGDANALRYVVSENTYEFGIRYLGVRRAYFSIRENNGVIDGHIYEYLTVSEIEVASAADFYIADSYVTAVGNKASGLLGFNNYIVEVYDVDTGKLLGYEIKEEQSVISFDTLWFDLKSVSGINSIKYVPATDTTDAAIYVNGLTTPWKNATVGGWNPLTALSRRYDIEFRTQYVYSYDAASGEYTKIEISVPMLFVQEAYLDTLTADVGKNNSGVNAVVNLASRDINKIMSDYNSLVSVFIENKELVTVDVILAFIGIKETV